jgi:hypothetical protein
VRTQSKIGARSGSACLFRGRMRVVKRYTCPFCDSIDVQFVIFSEELPEDGPVVQEMKRLAEEEVQRKNKD